MLSAIPASDSFPVAQEEASRPSLQLCISQRPGFLSLGATDSLGRVTWLPGPSCVVECRAASLAPTPTVLTTRSISRHGDMSPGPANTSLLRATDGDKGRPGVATPIRSPRRSPWWGSTHLVEVLAEEGPGLRGREVAKLGHEVHLALGQQGGRGP